MEPQITGDWVIKQTHFDYVQYVHLYTSTHAPTPHIPPHQTFDIYPSGEIKGDRGAS
jgi:hypothetical protein